ncbi:hypothetical protein O2N63_08585 [Aliiroseovarius sp. KMU-50]|uniref:DUF2497 domain-containing protein n=1 Tax=Aliiroseovarius salicola TaxID=3009082 RepID=A0ABT4W138_9RHOB|nr:hypothetical protein [Aliiroseovarius sp. KMU-50]MDA5094144.1 hypothetical protein [Aliiroseovarius sp. KMU-50]
MSDPVSNADIEDVLSSIRLLVSENATPRKETPAVTEVSADKEPADKEIASSDKLVLTPAFRVHDTPAPIDEEVISQTLDIEAVEHSDQQQITSDESLGDETLNDEALDQEIKAAQSEESDIPQSENNDLVSTPEEEGVMFLHRPISPEEEQVEEEETQDLSGQTSEQEIDVPSEEEPAGGVEAGGIENVEDIHQDAHDAFEDPTGEIVEPDWPLSPPIEETSAKEVPSLDHRVAELEDAVNKSISEFEPDLGDAVEDIGPGIFLHHRAPTDPMEPIDNSDTPTNWQEFDAEVKAFIENPADENNAEAAPAEQDKDEPILDEDDAVAVIDEEMLRELVTRLVREELQGEVGEKITRNVRRLVRREVERALTLKSLG